MTSRSRRSCASASSRCSCSPAPSTRSTSCPSWLQPVAYATPLYHGVELCRGAVLGTLGIAAAALHIAVLIGVLARRVPHLPRHVRAPAGRTTAFPGHAGRSGRSLAGARSLASVDGSHDRDADGCGSIPPELRRRPPAAPHARAGRDGQPAHVADHRQRVLRAAVLPAVDPHRLRRAGRRRHRRRADDPLRRVRRPGADGRVGDERRRLRDDDERVLQDQARQALRRRAVDTDDAGRRRPR